MDLIVNETFLTTTKVIWYRFLMELSYSPVQSGANCQCLFSWLSCSKWFRHYSN